MRGSSVLVWGAFWGAPSRPRATIKTIMSSVHRTFWTPGDTMDPPCFDGKEGVDGSSPSESFIHREREPRYGGFRVSRVCTSPSIEALGMGTPVRPRA